MLYQREFFFSQSVNSVTQSCPTLCNPMTIARQASLSITNFQSLLRLMSIESGKSKNVVQMNFYKTETDPETQEKKMLPKRKGSGGINWEYGTNKCTLPCIK